MNIAERIKMITEGVFVETNDSYKTLTFEQAYYQIANAQTLMQESSLGAIYADMKQNRYHLYERFKDLLRFIIDKIISFFRLFTQKVEADFGRRLDHVNRNASKIREFSDPAMVQSIPKFLTEPQIDITVILPMLQEVMRDAMNSILETGVANELPRGAFTEYVNNHGVAPSAEHIAENYLRFVVFRGYKIDTSDVDAMSKFIFGPVESVKVNDISKRTLIRQFQTIVKEFEQSSSKWQYTLRADITNLDKLIKNSKNPVYIELAMDAAPKLYNASLIVYNTLARVMLKSAIIMYNLLHIMIEKSK